MPELPDNNRDEARRWLANADDDLRAMQVIERDPDSPARIVCFLAHLVVEKSLKATLIDAAVPYKKVHDLVALYELCQEAERLPGMDAKMLESLTPWGHRRSLFGRFDRCRPRPWRALCSFC